MADPDYKLVYKTRDIDLRDPDAYNKARARIPTALDPYRYPEDYDELKRNVAQVRARNERYRGEDYLDHEPPRRSATLRDDVSASAGVGIGVGRNSPRPATTKTTYSVGLRGLEKESETTRPAPLPSVGKTMRDDDFEIRGVSTRGLAPSVARTVKEDDFEISGVSSRGPARPYDNRDYSRTERIYDIERPERVGGAYMVDMRDASVADVYTGNGARDADRGLGGYRNDPYEYEREPLRDYPRDPPPPPRASTFRESENFYARDSQRASAPIVVAADRPYMSGARSERAPTVARASRSQADFQAPSRASTRVFEDDRASTKVAPAISRQSVRKEDDDWNFVEARRDRAPTVKESFRDPIANDPRSPDTLRGRAREETGDDYVTLSPPPKRATERQSIAGGASSSGAPRSIMMRDDAYTAEERARRRRSRSIGFNEDQCKGHNAGERFAERPGAEAAMMGRYLKSYNVDDERMDYEYSSRKDRGGRGSDKELERRDERDEVYGYERRERERYEPQRQKSVRSKSRRRRDEEEDDDRSYVDRKYEKTVKTSYY